VSDPIVTARSILATIRGNIKQICQALRTANKNEHQLLTRELRAARKQEQEAKKYV
jgi:outer membrane PBP1 activator LpoA protein